jgi:hypothetical protein
MSKPSKQIADSKAGDTEDRVVPAEAGVQRLTDGVTAGPVAPGLTQGLIIGDASKIVLQPVTRRRSFQFSPQYRPALFRCLWLQVALFILTAMVLDMGRLNHLCRYAIVGQWVGIFIVMGRRPLTPTRGDLLFIRWGIVPLLFATPWLADWVWLLIGESTRSGLDRLQSLPR